MRFANSIVFPQTILVPNYSVKKKIINSFPLKSKNSKIIVIGFCYLEYLSKLFRKVQNNNNYNAYFTADLNSIVELKMIKYIYDYSKINNKKLIVFVHPRSNLLEWKKKLIKDNVMK